MKALVGASNQEKALVGAFSVIVQPVVEPMDRFTALVRTRMGGGTQLVWLTCPPIAVEVTGGVVVEGMEGMVRGMRFNVMEANLMVATETAAAGYDVLDLHYHLMHQVYGGMLSEIIF